MSSNLKYSLLGVSLITSMALANNSIQLNQIDVIDYKKPLTFEASSPNSDVHISNDKISQYIPISSGDIFKGLSGIQVGDMRNGGAVDINIRGMQGQSRVAITIDGTEQALNVYRGYGGTQQRSYIDPDLISEITITKEAGKSLENGISGIGGSVAIKTLSVDDIIPKYKNFGIRLTGKFWNNGLSEVKQPSNGSLLNSDDDLNEIVRNKRKNILESKAKSGSIALGYKSDFIDFVAAYSERHQGNYFAGKKGYQKYREIGPRPYWCEPEDYNEDYCQPVEEKTVAKAYKPGDEVLNSSANIKSLLLKTTIRPNDKHFINLGYNLYDSKHGEIMPSDIFRYDYGGIRQYPLGKTKIQRLNLNYHYLADNPLINLKTGVWFSNAKTNQLNAVDTPSSQEYIDDRGWVKIKNDRFGINIDNSSKFETSNAEYHFDIGLAFKNEHIGPQSSVKISQNDLWANRNYRHAKRSQSDIHTKLTYLPNDQVTLWVGTKYEKYTSKDLNREAVAIRENKTFKRLFVYTPDYSYYGYLNWFPDKNGNYDSTNPTKNNGIIHRDQNLPFDGMHYNDAVEKYGKLFEDNYDERTQKVVTGFKFNPAKSHKDHALSFSGGIKFEFIPNTFTYISYNQAARMPSLFETTMGTTQVQILHDNDLKPEVAHTWEVGISSKASNLISPSDNAQIKLSYFNNKFKNYITRYFDPSTDGMMRFYNSDSFKTSGLELQTSYDNGKFFSEFSANYFFDTKTCDRKFAQQLREMEDEDDGSNPYIDTPNCTDGSYMGSYLNTQNPPKYALNLNLGLRLFDEKLTLGSRIIHTSKPTVKINKPWQQSPTTKQIYYHAVTTVDLFSKYQFNDNAELNLSVQNLFNRYYIDPLAQSFMPAPGRTITIGLNYKF